MSTSKAVIRLYTQDNEWEYNAQKEGDPHFSAFLSSMQEACGELPDELLLPSSVGHIVQTGWDDYVDMYQLHTTVQAIQAAQKTNNKIPAWKSSPTRLICEYGSDIIQVVYNPIMRIVNTFPRWEMYAYADGDCAEDVTNHLAAMGDALYSAGVSMEEYRTLMVNHMAECDTEDLTCEGALVAMMRYVRDGIRASIGRDQPAAELYKIQLDKAIVALLHNAYLLAGIRGGCLSLYDIAWRRVPAILTRLGCCTDENTAGYYLREIAAIFMGKGDVRKVRAIPYLVNPSYNAAQHSMNSSIAQGDDLIRLYDAIWESTPEDIDPRDIGLATLLRNRDISITPAYTSFTFLLCEAHRMAENMLESRGIDYRLIPMYVMTLATTVAGRMGLTRIMRCLDLYMEKNMSTIDDEQTTRIVCFLQYAKKCIEMTPANSTRHLQSSPALVRYINTRTMILTAAVDSTV